MEEFDAVIVGASFAGLAVASKLKGNVLLLDRKDIGTNVTSACGSIAKFIEGIGCGGSILQTFDAAVLHSKNNEYAFPLADSFCTIDYFKFCREYFKQSGVDFRREHVKGIENGLVKTNKGFYKAKLYVDCSGWPAVLARSIDKNFVDEEKLTVAMETEIPYKDNKLRFFVNKQIVKNGIGWLFPAGKNSRFGVASYGKNFGLANSLKKFVNSYGLKANGMHGNYIPYNLRKPVVGNIFVVGDAVGNVLPLTAEGIRPSIRAGIYCGNIVQQILENKISLAEGSDKYGRFCLKNRRYYNYLLKAQKKITSAGFAIKFFVRLLTFSPIAKFGLRAYQNF